MVNIVQRTLLSRSFTGLLDFPLLTSLLLLPSLFFKYDRTRAGRSELLVTVDNCAHIVLAP